MKTFGKCKSCPSSQKLLGFLRNELSWADLNEVESHLENCEFCSTESEFLAHFPINDEPFVADEIPTALRQLAETLLGGKQKEYRILRELLSQTEKIPA